MLRRSCSKGSCPNPDRNRVIAGSSIEDDVQDLRTCLFLFYKTYNPEKIVNVEQIVRDYATRGGGAWERKVPTSSLRPHTLVA